MGLINSTHNHRHVTNNYEGNKTINVTEKRAPTDESVRLLNEMEAKALQNIVHKIVIDENHLKGVVVFYKDEFMFNGFTLFIKFILNEKEYSFEEQLKIRDLHIRPHDNEWALFTAYQVIHEKFVKTVSVLLAAECGPAMQEKLLPR